MIQLKPFLFAIGACSLLALSGCGGGGSGSNAPITLSARLTTSDFVDEDSQRYYDIYVANATRTDTARVAMSSEDFDTQFYVYEQNTDGTYTLIDSNDDADGDTTDSDDTFPVIRGVNYRILATSALSNERGDYLIRFSSELGRPGQVTSLDQKTMKLRSSEKFALPAPTKKKK